MFRMFLDGVWILRLSNLRELSRQHGRVKRPLRDRPPQEAATQRKYQDETRAQVRV